MFNIFIDEISFDKYFIVEYYLETTKTLRDAAWALAVGQSVGNPNVRNEWETEELFRDHSCVILDDGNLDCRSGIVRIGFPRINISESDGVSHLLCCIMGGQLDIDIVKKCRVIDIRGLNYHVEKPGIQGLRKATGVYNKPLLGAIIKPKTGVSAQVLLEMTTQLVEGGVNWIKEDEILSSPNFCTLEERLCKIAPYLEGKNVIYHFCINSDAPELQRRVELVNSVSDKIGVHINFWSGFGAYRTARNISKKLFIHFQKSGDKILTKYNHDFGIDWNVLCGIVGQFTDAAHVGMIGGYGNDNEEIIYKAMDALRNADCIPALSCGLHPGLVQHVRNKVGDEVLLNAGGSIMGHPNGSTAGALAMRQAIDGEHGKEYQQAIDKWGYVE